MEEQNSEFVEKRIDMEAAEWVSKHARGLTPSEQDDFFSWMANDSRNSEWFYRHKRTWDQLNMLAQWKPEHSEKPNPSLLKYKEFVIPTWAWQAVAACCVLGFAAWIYLVQSSVESEGHAVQDFVAHTYEKHLLPDGSKVEMKDGAALKVNFGERERKIELVSSEAHFEVEKNPEKPFVVHAKGFEFKAIGTAFSVKIKGDEVELLVTEGIVEMSRLLKTTTGLEVATQNLDTRQQVRAGEYSVAAIGGVDPFEVKQLDPNEIEQLLSWKPRSLRFDQIPLKEVIEAFNQRNSTQIRIDDAALQETIVFASFHSADIPKLIDLLKSTLDVEAHEQADGRIVLYRNDGSE